MSVVIWSSDIRLERAIHIVILFIFTLFIVPIYFWTILDKPTGYDRVRNTEIGNKDFELDVLEEAYTTEHWLVRIYKVKDLENRGV